MSASHSLRQRQPCPEFQFHARRVCPKCGSDRIERKQARGDAAVRSYTVVHRAPSPALARAVPDVVAKVALAEGPHITIRIAGILPEKLRMGMAFRAKHNHWGKIRCSPRA